MTAGQQAATNSSAPVSRIKRWIAVFGALATLGLLLVVFGAVSFTVSRTGDGSDPDRAFSPTQDIPSALNVELVWATDADDLVREVERTTREQLGSMWLRSDDALARAAEGETSGLEVWFVDAALDATLGRFGSAPDDPDSDIESTTRSVAPALRHRLRVDFYSLDGQVVVLSVETIRVRPTDAAGKTVEVVERTEAMAVLSDGNWRLRHLERLTPPDDGFAIPS